MHAVVDVLHREWGICVPPYTSTSAVPRPCVPLLVAVSPTVDGHCFAVVLYSSPWSVLSAQHFAQEFVHTIGAYPGQVQRHSSKHASSALLDHDAASAGGGCTGEDVQRFLAPFLPVSACTPPVDGEFVSADTTVHLMAREFRVFVELLVRKHRSGSLATVLRCIQVRVRVRVRGGAVHVLSVTVVDALPCRIVPTCQYMLHSLSCSLLKDGSACTEPSLPVRSFHCGCSF